MKNLGLLEELQDFKAYVLGNNAMPWIQYRPDGNWEDALPTYENQTTLLGQETSGCTVWGGLNQIEIFNKGVYGESSNYSERFTYLGVPIDPKKGTDPQNVYNVIRRDGLVDESVLPMTKRLSEYLDTSKITQSIRAKGQNWLLYNDLQHEWLWTKRPDNYIEILKRALKTSPLGVSVSAWNQEIDASGNLVYVSTGKTNNHYCVLIKIDDEGYPWVFDSYDHYVKRLSKDHNIRRAKRIWLNKTTKPAMQRHIFVLQGVVAYLKSLVMPKDILYYANQYITNKYDPTPDDEYPDEVSCAWSLSFLEKQVDPTFKRIPGTWTLWDYYEKHPRFKRTTEPKPGTRIISPTVAGKPFPGHCGVFMEDMTIASNDSDSGLFLKNFTYDTWKARYVQKGGYPIYLYDRI